MLAVKRESERELSPRQAATAVASRGPIRPPLVYLCSIGLGLFAHLFWPVQVLPASVSAPIGIALVLPACALFISSVRTFRKAGTPVPGNRPTTMIVRAGPYRFSRNPDYVGQALVTAGLGVLFGTVWVLIVLVPVLLLVRYGVIAREERYLERRFGQEYRDYCARVRRWL